MINKLNDYKIVNIVVSTDLSQQLDLDYICKNLNNCEYEPEVYHALIYRLKDPKLSILVNKSGKLILTGSKSLENIDIALNIFYKELIGIGYEPKKLKIKIQNLVASASLGKTLNLEAIALDLENTKYEPKQFPGLVYRLSEPKVVLILFGSGKILCMGAKSFEDAQIGIEKTKKRVKGCII